MASANAALFEQRPVWSEARATLRPFEAAELYHLVFELAGRVPGTERHIRRSCQ